MEQGDDSVRAKAAVIQQQMYERQEAARQRRQIGLRAFVSAHVALLASAGLVLLIAFRLLAVAHGDQTTALALASAGTGTATLVPLIFNVGISLSPWLIVAAFLRAAEPPSLRPAWLQGRVARMSYIGCFYLPAIFLAPWRSLITFTAVGALFLWAIPSQRQANERTIREAVQGSEPHQFILRSLQADTRVLGVFGLLTFATLFASFTDAMWLPAERGDIDGSATTFYVLETNDETLLLLFDEDRTVRMVPNEDVSDRQLCSGLAQPPSLVSLAWGDRPDYVECP